MPSILRLIALALLWVGGAALLPALVSARNAEGTAPIFLATTLACVFFAGALRLSCAGVKARMRRLHAFAALAALWLLVPVVAAPAVSVAGGLDLWRAWFEALSAFTTTGFTAVHEAPRSLYVWFALLQWSGGLLTIVSGVAVLAPAGIAGLPHRAQAGVDGLEIVDTAGVVRDVAPIYGAATLLALVVLLASGNSLYVALCLASAATSSGSHVPPQAMEALRAGVATPMMMIPFILWSATSVRWHRALVTRRIHAAPEQSESLLLLGYWVVAGIILGGIIFRDPSDISVRAAVEMGLFSAASLIATSGFAAGADVYHILPPALVIGMALIGGGALSVTGGLKLMRLRAMLLRAQGDLMRLISPHLVQPARTGEGGVGSAMRGVWVGAVALMATLAATTILMSISMPSLQAAVTGAVAALTNTGPIYDATDSDWPAISSLPPLSMLGAAFAMIAGRLETVGAFVLIHLAFWRN
ncbi:hypothetical protein V5F77_09975 [Xanthobacter sp. DSM 24535]|uniref:hypothetical protein n=1 Tax=Roseixanthobacter psychrophilus TaxID=3119917 RepID=UPI00372A7935